MAKQSLAAAQKDKKDEFYTQWVDIEREMNAYLEYDPDVFRGKVILLPCDDPEWSNFTKFFALHFAEFGIKKLISMSYAPDSNPAGPYYMPTLFEMADPKFDATKTRVNGKLFVLEHNDVNEDGVVNIDDLQWKYLEGGGDFRSDEVMRLRDEADIIITNPPFSLFRDFLAWILEADKEFAIIGTQNAIGYKEIFPLFKANKVWLGKGFKGNVAHFASPYDDVATSADREEGMIRVSGVMWFTNIDHGRRHEPLQLMTMADSIKYSKHKEVRGREYAQYDNYDAIDVPFTDAIPSDYGGLMGVPITFLDKYNPDQFEILGITKSWDDGAGLKTKIYPTQTQVSKDGWRSQVSKLNDGGAIVVDEAPSSTYYMVGDVMLVQPYARILVRRRKS